MKRILYSLVIYSLVACSEGVVHVSNLKKEDIVLEKKKAGELFITFEKLLTKERNVKILTMDSNISVSYSIKPLKAGFFSDHELSIDRKKYLVTNTASPPFVYYNGFIFYPKKYYYLFDNFDTIELVKVEILQNTR